MRRKHIGGLLCAATLATAAAGASAQLAVYKVVDPAGHILYTDQSDLSPALPEAAPESEASPVPGRPAVSSRRSAQVNINEAQRRLAQAELKRRQGIAPLPGERVQGSSGETVSYAYWRRQEKLRIEVEQARRRVNALQRHQLARR